MEMEKQVMPKWFNGLVYSEGDRVSNPFTGESVELTAEELSMYDLDWFRRANAKAYMVLLD
jgi:hypothetical protein